jgi:two-component system, NarL family, response regulator
MNIRVLIVDDYVVLREGMKNVLAGQAGVVVAGEVANGFHAVVAYREIRPDVLLLNMDLSDVSPVAVIREIKKFDLHASIVGFSGSLGYSRGRAEALEAGATSFISRGFSRLEILGAVRSAGNRTEPRSSVLASDPKSEPEQLTEPERLSRRECEVLKRVAAGEANKEIAISLGISSNTVRAHIKNILRKMKVKDRTAAVVTGIRLGIPLLGAK